MSELESKGVGENFDYDTTLRQSPPLVILATVHHTHNPSRPVRWAIEIHEYLFIFMISGPSDYSNS